MLTAEQRQAVRNEFVRQLSALPEDKKEPVSVTKQEIIGAVNATDEWIEANMASYNQTLPENIRNTFSSLQKARLFYLTALKRFKPENDDGE
jgi:hypothetical protein